MGNEGGEKEGLSNVNISPKSPARDLEVEGVKDVPLVWLEICKE